MRKASHDTGRPDGLSMCSHWDRAGWKPQALERSTRTLPRGHELDLTPGNGTLYTCDFLGPRRQWSPAIPVDLDNLHR
ncbi:hypothetical protein HDC31_003998 [Microbacterium sp. JAI119]|nr:hypothetical protein AVP41_01269 [Microbacterium sp. TNHR37B]NYF30413.1 hypothetical protein [Microbacterium sp. JAI119]